MAGIYLHIPFCKSRCRYCDFYSTTLLSKREQYVSAILAEAELRKDYLHGKPVQTIYFGGGTPSQLRTEDIGLILQRLKDLFDVQTEAEITIEANPGDLSTDYLYQLHTAGVNRLSIGIQSFNDQRLLLLGRRHTVGQAIQAVQYAREAGFTNISIDLIYGIPNQTIDEWKDELKQALSLNIEHISTYCLTYEQETEMSKMLAAGQISAIDDDTANEMYDILRKILTDSGYIHYEVSNFAKPKHYSQHNSAYWNGTEYLGLGAAAHSYDGKSRQWNTNNLEDYIRQVKSVNLQAETEYLTEQDIYNERVMLGLRTMNGIDLSQFSKQELTYCLRQAQPFIDSGKLCLSANHIKTTEQGINILNLITRELMQVIS